MDNLVIGQTYAFGCFGGASFKVLATYKDEAWVYWIEDGKTTVEDIEKDALAELIE